MRPLGCSRVASGVIVSSGAQKGYYDDLGENLRRDRGPDGWSALIIGLHDLEPFNERLVFVLDGRSQK